MEYKNEFEIEFRRLSDLGVTTISEAKAVIVREAHQVYVETKDFAVINAIDLKASGRRMVGELVRQGFARPIFTESWSDKVYSWVVTRERWAAEFIQTKGRK